MPTTERTWTERAEALPGWDDIAATMRAHGIVETSLLGADVFGIVAAYCMERTGWLHGLDHRPGEPGTYRARYLLPEPDGRMGVTPMHRADTAVQAIILAAEARHRVDPARGWC